MYVCSCFCNELLIPVFFVYVEYFGLKIVFVATVKLLQRDLCVIQECTDDFICFLMCLLIVLSSLFARKFIDTTKRMLGISEISLQL